MGVFNSNIGMKLEIHTILKFMEAMLDVLMVDVKLENQMLYNLHKVMTTQSLKQLCGAIISSTKLSSKPQTLSFLVDKLKQGGRHNGNHKWILALQENSDG